MNFSSLMNNRSIATYRWQNSIKLNINNKAILCVAPLNRQRSSGNREATSNRIKKLFELKIVYFHFLTLLFLFFRSARVHCSVEKVASIVANALVSLRSVHKNVIMESTLKASLIGCSRERHDCAVSLSNDCEPFDLREKSEMAN